MSAENIRDEVNRGGRLVVYVYCVSIVLMTFKRASDVTLVRAGHNRASAGWTHTALSLLLGWWGIPWGPIYTIECLYRNLSGGLDVTDDVLRAILPAPAVPNGKSSAAEPPALVTPPAPRPGFNWKVAGLMAGGAATIVAVAVSAYCYNEQRHLTVVLANGLARPYRVELNSETHTLPPYGAKVLELPEGDFTLRDASGEHVVGGEQRFTFARPLLDHLGDAWVAVINPDRCAFLANVEVPYYRDGETPPKDEAPVYSLLANRPTYFFTKPDYVVVPAEQRVSMPSGTTRLVKHRLDVVRVSDLPAMLANLQEKSGYDAVREHLQLEARQRTDEDLLMAAFRSLKPADARAFLQPRLAERPLLVEWHRYYQHVTELNFPEHNLLQEYRTLLAAEPDNGALHYLLGRVVDSDEEQARCWQAALAAKQPCLYAHNAIGFDALTEAQFADALAHFDASAKAGIESLSLRRYRHFSYLALGRAREVLAELAAERKADPLNLELVAAELQATSLVTPDRAALTKLKKAHLAAAKTRGSSESDLADADAYLEAEIAQLCGDLAGFAKLVSRFDAPFYRFRAALSEGRLRDAEKSLDDQVRDANAALLLYLLAARQNDTAADRYFQAGLTALKADGAEGRRVAALASAERPDAATLCRVHLALETKRILLTALGTRVPADRAAYFEMARKLNFIPEFPQQFLATVLKP